MWPSYWWLGGWRLVAVGWTLGGLVFGNWRPIVLACSVQYPVFPTVGILFSRETTLSPIKNQTPWQIRRKHTQKRKKNVAIKPEKNCT